MSVHASKFGVSQFGAKWFEKTFAESQGKSSLEHSLDFLILCGKVDVKVVKWTFSCKNGSARSNDKNKSDWRDFSYVQRGFQSRIFAPFPSE